MTKSRDERTAIFARIQSHYKAGTLYMSSKSFAIRMVISRLERIKKLYNGGIYEVPGSGKSYYDEGAEEYLQRRMRTKSWQNEEAAMINFLEAIPDEISVLDVPFGTGRFVHLYLRKKMKVFGIDRSPDMIEAAKNALDTNFCECEVSTGDALALPFYDNEFDLVVSFRFLPHIITYDQVVIALREFSRVTRTYAILQIGEREESNYRRRLPYGHEKMESWFYPEEVENLLNESGFQVIAKSGPLHNATTTTMKYVKNTGKWHGYLCRKNKSPVL